MRLMLTLLAFVGLGAVPALALTCLPPDVVRAYRHAAEAEEAYVVVYGRLAFDEKRLPQVDWNKQHKTPPDTLIPARISGHALSLEGFKTRFSRRVTLNAQCFGPWCANVKSGADYLAFLEQTRNGYVLTLDPCGGMGFPEPSREDLEQVVRCLRGGACELGRLH